MYKQIATSHLREALSKVAQKSQHYLSVKMTQNDCISNNVYYAINRQLSGSVMTQQQLRPGIIC